MNDELINNLSDSDLNNKSQIDICTVCGKNPCACSSEASEPIMEEKSEDNSKLTKTKPPKVSWI